MDEKEWKKVKEIFLAALEKEIEFRPKYLDEVCAQNSVLRTEVESLLANHEEVEDFIETPAFQAKQIFADSSPQSQKYLVKPTNPKSQIPNPKSLRGDLDNIILMALRKEPARRYYSVADFSDDISKYLNGLPVSARPNTLTYRTEKFINAINLESLQRV